MAEAAVGDDVYGEDPTVNKLERMAAELVGKEAAIFVSSGTMGNTAAILSHTSRGEEAILGIDSHIMSAEAGGMASLGGVMPKPLATNHQGMMSIEDIKEAISPDDEHYPRTRLILVENTYGSRNGYPIHPGYFKQIKTLASRHDIKVHLDGARLFNAAVALETSAQEMASHVDSLSFCLSKGLCAPVGSLLCGSAAFIKEARRTRKVLGGGMRQAGVLAAAGVVALEDMVDRLRVDHENARLLATGLAKFPGVEVELDQIRTNIVFFGLDPQLGIDAYKLASRLKDKYNILLDVDGKYRIRAVTHYWVGKADVEQLLNRLVQEIRR